jgi:hypothetical protein
VASRRQPLPKIEPAETDIGGKRNDMTAVDSTVHDRCILGATALIALAGLLIGEKIPINDGLGWDGLIYGTIAKGGPFNLGDFLLDQYALRRILPSLVVHYSLRAAGISLNDTHVVYGFGLLNVACLSCIAWLWVRIARLLGIGVRGRWLGFCGLILNFAVLKNTTYYPVLTDIPAYAIGCGMLLAYLRGSVAGLCLLTAAGAFVWAPLLPQGLVLLLFPREQADDIGACKCEAGQRTDLRNYLIAGFATYYALLAIGWSLSHANLPVYGFIDPLKSALPLSLAVVAAYLFFAILRLVDFRQAVRAIETLFLRDWRRLLIVAGGVVVLRFAYGYLAPDQGRLSGQLYLLILGVKSVNKPGVFLVGHAVYFGPIILMAIILWSGIGDSIRRVGFGLSLAVLLSLVQGLDGESRHLIHAFPLIVPFVVQKVERQNWTRWQYVVFGTISLIASKVWLTINSAGMESNANLLEFPWQRYAMNYGVFMTNATYLIQGAIAVVLGIALYRFGEKVPHPGGANVVEAVRSVWKRAGALQGPRRYLFALASSAVMLMAIIVPALAVRAMRIDFAPLAGNDVAVTTQNRSVDISVLLNDMAPVGQLDLTSVKIVEVPKSGSVTLASAAGVVNYVPNPGFIGQDFFKYTISNRDGTRSNAGRVKITIKP